MVEKKIHQIWIGDFKIPKAEQAYAKTMQELHPDYEYKLWREGESLPPNLQYWYDKFYETKQFVFCADILRIWIIYKYGGFYLDIDFDIKKKLDPFFKDKGTFFYHNDSDFTIPNNIFSAESGSEVLKFCIDSINHENSWHGPSWFGQTIKKYLKLPYEIPQNQVEQKLNEKNINFFQYHSFELEYALHTSLYSWEPKKWEKLRKGEQL